MKFNAIAIALTALTATAIAAPTAPVEVRDCRGEVDARASCWNQLIWAFDRLDNWRGGNRDGLISKADVEAGMPVVSPGVCKSLILNDFDAADNMRLGGARDGLISYPDATFYLGWMHYDCTSLPTWFIRLGYAQQVVPSAPHLLESTLAPPAPQVSTPSTASGAAASPSHADPWAQAYEILKERELGLPADYAKHLSSVQAGAAAGIDLSAPWSVESTAERLAKFVLWSDPTVKNALSGQPHAALAWSGVSLLLPLVTSGTTQQEAMLRGFNAVGDVKIYWRICEETYLQSKYREHYERLIGPLAKLYSYVIEYQARVICHLSRSQLSRAWHNVARWNDWDKANEVEKLSRQCSDCIKERAHLQDLASDYEGYKNFNSQKVEGTCEWFFTDERFGKWRESQTSSLLWVSADPGCGESVLSRALIDDHRLSTRLSGRSQR
ncbi:hypothetical protein GE09DRAFT_1294182 [Coniochaeta sp. 2T2.1]|nr:hypothetical protein GE09DRAFT_1294182 [Coniochaeta sp. 2T2.1]